MREAFSSNVAFHKKSWLIWTSHIFHRYRPNWCHVIETIIH